eukprot:gene1096-4324_t
MSFIQRVARMGANALLGELRVTTIGKGTVTATVPVLKQLCNSYGSLHGGAAATLVDIVGTMALLTKDPLRAGVSVEINTTYLRSAKEGEHLIITGRLWANFVIITDYMQKGSAHIYLQNTDEVVVTGRHTKAL